MTRTAVTLLGTAFALGLSGSAYAQSSGGGMDPATMTCGDLAALGQDEMQSALDMVASNNSMAITGATGTSAPAAGATTGSSGTTETGGTGSDTTAGASTGTTGATGTAGTSGSSGDTTTAGTTTGTAGSSESSGSTGDTATAGAATGNDGSSGSASGDSGTMVAGSLDPMQIDQIMATCMQSPERLVSDVYSEHSGANQ